MTCFVVYQLLQMDKVLQCKLLIQTEDYVAEKTYSGAGATLTYTWISGYGGYTPSWPHNTGKCLAL